MKNRDNQDRAEAFRNAAAVGGYKDIDTDPETAVTDLLVDLRHFCAQMKVPLDVGNLIRISLDHFEAEVAAVVSDSDTN